MTERKPWLRTDPRRLAEYVQTRAERLLGFNRNRLDLQTQGGVRTLAAAIYEALLEADIQYDLEQYILSEDHQYIRSAEEILGAAPRRGTCLDLSVLFAGLCLDNRLIPILVVLEDHALVAISATHLLDEWSAPGRAGGAAFLEPILVDQAGWLARQVNCGNLIAVECTGFARSESLSRECDGNPETGGRVGGVMTFDRAVAAGAEQLRGRRALRFAVDLAVARFKWNYESISPIQQFGNARDHHTGARFGPELGITRSFQRAAKAFLDEYLISETGEVPFGGRDSDLRRLSLRWSEALPEAGAPLEVFSLLSWRTRLSAEMIGREAEKADLLKWANSGPKMRLRFLLGPGGAGKTRLAAEVADNLRGAGWHAGFVALEDEVPLPVSEQGLLLVIDYPEAYPSQLRVLLTKAAKVEPRAPIRLLLLSRQPGSRWFGDITECGAATICDAREIGITKLDRTEARQLFQDAAKRLAKHRKLDEPRIADMEFYSWLDQNPHLHGLPLFITAAAIHFVDVPGDTLKLEAVRIISALVERERSRLDKVGVGLGWRSRAASRLAGLAALRNEGLDMPAIRRLCDPSLELGLPADTGRVVDDVHKLSWWTGGRLRALPPDIVAAELMRQVLVDGDDRTPEWIWAVLGGPDVLEVELLDRRVQDMVTLHGPGETLLRDAVIGMVGSSVERAKALRAFLDGGKGGFRLALIAVVVGRVLLAQDDINDEEHVRILNYFSTALSESGDEAAALAAIREAVDLSRRLTPGNAKGLAASLNNLSVRLRKIGDGAAALAAIREAVDLSRGWAHENPARFAPNLAAGLHNLGIELSEAGDEAAALAATREAVDIYRGLARQNPVQFAPDLATGLNSLSTGLRRAGDKAGALAASREAVDIHRRLARENPSRFAPDLTLSLYNVSGPLSEEGDDAGALAAIREVVDIHRRLARENPTRFAPDLAMSLHKLWALQGDGPGALETIRETVELHRGLARENPARFAPDLRASLKNLALQLIRSGTLVAIREAVELYRELEHEDPTQFAPDLARSLGNLSNRLGETGDRAAMLAAIREAVELYRRLARENPTEFAPDLAASLNHLSNELSEAGDAAGALVAAREAVDIHRWLAHENPAQFALDVARSLYNLSARLSGSGDGWGALGAVREAVDIYRGLAHENPARSAADLARSLHKLYALQHVLGDRAGALAAIREVVELYRRLGGENPARFAPDRATSLNHLSVELSEAGDAAGALVAVREAVETYRSLAHENAARFAPNLAMSLNNLSNQLSEAGDGASALMAIQEAVLLYRGLAHEDSARFAPDLAGYLSNLSIQLSEAGDAAGALAANREAVDIRRGLARENATRFAPDLAMSLNDLSTQLGEAGDGAGALAAIQEAVVLYRGLAHGNPAQFAPYLAISLNNLSIELSAARDGAGALAAVREEVEVRRGLARENAALFAPDLARSLSNLSVRLSYVGDGASALAAIREAEEIIAGGVYRPL
jgi:hypothetical protein